MEQFFNKIQVTCVGARVGEFAINESDHALIKCNREQGTAFSYKYLDGREELRLRSEIEKTLN